MKQNPFPASPCEAHLCRPYWVATRSYTARCPEGTTGCTVTATRQARSFISEADAARLARLAAKAAAEAALECQQQIITEEPGSPYGEYPASCSYII